MKINKETLTSFTLSYALDKIVPLESTLFIDIETTGFTARSSYLYLIGCVYYQENQWHLIQWFAENYEQEADILSAFFEFAGLYRYLVHFNGNNFDLPFLMQKCDQFGIPDFLDAFEGIDLYRRISPFKSLLKLPNCKQKTLEHFLDIQRTDAFSGGELIGIYHDYVKNPSEYAEKSLLLHNADDMQGMLEILPMLAYYDLCGNEAVRARKVQANTFRDLYGNTRRELLITVTLPTPLPRPVTANANNCYFRGEGAEGTIKVPVFDGELKYFYSNYKDYYYLPEEDIALHKSVASFVDRQYRVQASAATCYTRKHSSYLPEWEGEFGPFFKRDYKDKQLYFELTDELKRDRQAFTRYANEVLQMIISSC